MTKFFEGFMKRASMPGQKSGLGGYGAQPGSLVTATPKTLQTTASAFKPNPAPMARPVAAKHNLSPTAKLMGPGAAPKVKMQVSRGVSSMAI